MAKKGWVAFALSISLSILIISIPFSIATVHAEILSVDAYGKAGVSGYLYGTGDVLHISALFSSNVSPHNLEIHLPENQYFNECKITENGYYLCSYTGLPRDIPGGRYYFEVVRKDKTVNEKKAGEYIVDIEKPKIIDFHSAVSDGMLNIIYSVTDTACESCGNACSGFDSIALLNTNTLLYIDKVNTSGCARSGNINLDLKNLQLAQGKNNLCLKVKDRVLLESSACKEFLVDFEKPQIGNLYLKDNYNQTINYSTMQGKDIKAVVEIKEDELAEVYGDFSALNIYVPDNFKNLKAECNEVVSGIYSCYWRNLVLDGVSGQIEIVLNASDKSGNLNSVKKIVTLQEDKSPPDIKKIVNNGQVQEKKIYVKPGQNIFEIWLGEDVSGYSSKNLFIDTSLSGGVSITPETCTKEPEWVCRWKFNINKESVPAEMSGDSRGTVYIHSESKDDAGNTLRAPLVYEMIVDETAPEFKNIEVSPACPYSGQELVINAIIKDKNPVSLVAYADKISSGDKMVSGECQLEEENSTCTLKIGSLFTSYIKTNLIVEAIDKAGNKATKQVPVEVCEPDLTTKPNFVWVEVGSVGRVDKRTLSAISVPVFVNLIITSSGKIVDRSVECNAEEAHFVAYDAIILKVPKQSTDANELNFECRMSFIVKKDKRVVIIPEIETVHIKIPLYNNPLGEISDSMKQKIDEVDKQINDIDKQIKEWESYSTILGVYCTIAEMMGKVNSALQGLKAVIYSIMVPKEAACVAECTIAVEPLCFEHCRSSVRLLWSKICQPLNTFYSVVNNFIWPTSYPIPNGKNTVGLISRTACTIYSCRICNYQFWLGWAAKGAAKGLSSIVNVQGGAASPSPSKKVNIQAIPMAVNEEQEKIEETYYSGGTINVLVSEINPESWIWDPYKSIHYARTCLCLPALIYNMKKDRQIKCMYKNCLEQTAKVGLPSTACDYSYKERECLYVDSAQWKLKGYGSFGDNFVNAALLSLPELVVAFSYLTTCPEWNTKEEGLCLQDAVEYTLANPRTQLQNVGCGLTGAAITIGSIYTLLSDFKIDNYNRDIQGMDHCMVGGGK
ncbi:MAG: hypothetical protein QXK37_03890 [Candidatus Woesearchaeota archaeon]